MITTLRTLAATLLVTALVAPAVHADVVSVEIVERGLIEEGRHFGDTGAYEQIVGRITFAIDPADPVNQVIVNLDRAPRNGRGLVEATADLLILAPADPQLGNGAALIDIANRGRLSALGFNRGGAGPFGDGFLMKRGLHDRLGRLGIRRAVRPPDPVRGPLGRRRPGRRSRLRRCP